MMQMTSDLARHAGRYYGKYSGEVTSVKDPDHTGRIEVRVPSVLTPAVTVWARPCFAAGHFFVPPVGAMVWVEFEAGDVSYPLWVGTWYPRGGLPKPADKDEAVGRVVHTPSGHVVELCDEAGDEKIVIGHNLGSLISIDKNGSILAAGHNGASLSIEVDKSEVVLKSDQGPTVTLDASGAVAVGLNGAKVEILDGKVRISGLTDVTLAAQKVTLDAASVDLGTGATSPAVLADGLIAFFGRHIHPTGLPGAPTSPPAEPMFAPSPVFSTSVKVAP